MRNKINLFIIMLLISTLFFGFMSYPITAELITGGTKTIDWDDFLIGATSGTGSFYSWARSGGDDFRIVNDYINSTPYMLYQYWDSYGVNYDAVDSGNIYITDEDVILNTTEIRIYHNNYGYDWSGTVESGIKIWNFYRNGTIEIKLGWKTTHYVLSGIVVNYNGYVMYNYTDSEWNMMWTGGASGYGGVDSYLRIFNVSQDYAYATIGIELVQRSNGAILKRYKGYELNSDLLFSSFDRLEVTYGFTNGASDNQVLQIQEIDDIVFFSETYVPPEYDVSMWDYIGDLNRDGTQTLPYIALEEQYQISFTGELKAVDLFVHSNQISQISSSLYDYILYINGETLGVYPYPVAFIPYQNHYLIRWYNINKTITDEYLTFEFGCAEFVEGKSWILSTSSIDNDGDGNINYRWGQDGDAWINGEFDQTYLENFDLSMRFYYTGDPYDPNYNYTDYIGIKDNPPYYTYVNIPISYTVSTKEYDNYLEIWRDGDRYGSDQGFGGDGENGLFLTEYSDTVGFVPLASGSYSVNIRRDGVNVTAYAFTVLDNPITDYYIYTIPNPSQHPNQFTVYYKYFHGEGKQGILTIHNSQTFSDPLSHLYYIYLTANTTGNFSYSPSAMYNLLYLSMGIEISTGIYTLASFPNNPHIHYIKDFASSNYIDLRYDIVYMDTSPIQTIMGHHNHIGSYVYITDNGEIVQDVSNKNSFIFQYTVVSSGSHEVKLILSTSNGTVTLDTKYYVASTEAEPEEPDEYEVLGEYKIWLGVGIIVLFLLFPLGISIKSFVEVPLIVYIAMGSIGVGISVSLGFLEMYWLLLLLVALVTGAVISKWG